MKAPNLFVDYLGGSRSATGKKDMMGRLLVWRYEGSRTLEQYLEEKESFPMNMVPVMLDRELPEDATEEVMLCRVETCVCQGVGVCLCVNVYLYKFVCECVLVYVCV